MDRFERLLDTEATDVERALLESAADDVPSARARKRTLAAMGVGAGVVVSATHAAHAATKLAATGSVSVAKGIGSVSGVLILKWVGTGALVGSVVAASIATVTTPGLLFSKHAAPVETAAPVAAAVSSPSRVTARSAGEQGLIPAAPGEPEVTRAAASPPPSRGERLVSPTTQGESPLAPAGASPSVAANVPAPAGTNVSAEVASLDRARSALALGDPRAALERLAAHDAAFPRGTLEPEAVVLRVRALIALGQHAEGARVAERFIAAHPESAQAGRLRALVGDR